MRPQRITVALVVSAASLLVMDVGDKCGLKQID